MHIKEVNLTENRTASISCFQYDFGQLIHILGSGITQDHVIQWSYNGITGVDSRAIVLEDGELYSAIPNDALKTTGPIKGFIFIFDAEKGNTTNVIDVKISARASIDEHTSEDDIPIYQQLILDTIAAKEAIEASAILYEDIVLMEEQSDGSIKIIRRV